ncbi:hypothetical protein [Halorhabdus rudnickae]|uniref:hypothetical protein n=1 Tax=Halorhabdus rudnickae TaxID=1775544 RepID=UPI0010823EB3|nr:hypothetical protein [Halorhabdus rudnickae]
MSDTDVNPADLQRQLDDIRGAMGLTERYPGRARLWLLAGILVGTVAIAVQVTFFFHESISATAYVVIWGGFVIVAVLTLWLMAARLPKTDAPETAPSWRALFGSLGVFLVAVSSVPGEVAGQVGGLDRALLYFGIVLAVLGLALLLSGVVLSAYRVRRRDRLVFYVGGAWTLVFASMLPYVDVLRYLGLGIFGALFALYAVLAYVYLTR